MLILKHVNSVKEMLSVFLMYIKREVKKSEWQHYSLTLTQGRAKWKHVRVIIISVILELDKTSYAPHDSLQ